MTRMTASEFLATLNATLEHVATRHERIVLESQSGPLVALVPIEDLELIEGVDLPDPITPLRPITPELIDEAISKGRL